MLSFVWILTLPVFMLIHTRASPLLQNPIPGEGSVNSSFELSFKDFQLVVYCKKSSLKLSFYALNKFLYSLWCLFRCRKFGSWPCIKNRFQKQREHNSLYLIVDNRHALHQRIWRIWSSYDSYFVHTPRRKKEGERKEN